jgi:hypothetical protein
MMNDKAQMLRSSMSIGIKPTLETIMDFKRYRAHARATSINAFYFPSQNTTFVGISLQNISAISVRA